MRVTGLLMILVGFVYSQQGIFFAEKADVYCREKGLPGALPDTWPVPSFGHVGIYMDWFDFAEPSNPFYQMVIASSGGYPDPNEDPSVRIQTLKNDYFNTVPVGIRTKNLSAYKRRRLLEDFAFFQRGALYGFILFNINGNIWYLRSYKSPKVPGVSPGYFRCDGFVEWCYEQIGEEIVPFDEVPFPLFPILPSMFPKQLFYNLSEFTPVPPDFYVISPEWHDTVQGEVSIIVDVNDGENGSGPYVVKAFLDHEPIYPPLDKYSPYYIGEDEHKEDIEGTYIIQWNTSYLEEGLHTIYIRAYDQAGNHSDGYVEVYVKPIGGPCIQSHYPPDGA